MASITITANVTVDIHLEDISMESYNRLTAFLAGLEHGEPVETAKATPEPEKPVEKPVGKGKGHSTLDTLAHEPRTEPLYKLLTNAKTNPDKYDWGWLKVSDLKSLLPELLRQCDNRFIGHALSQFVEHGLLEKRMGGKQKFQYNYPVLKAAFKPPVSVGAPLRNAIPDEPVTIKSLDEKAGEMLRQARQSADLTLSELSKEIGYDASIIHKWESGIYHMATVQREAINRYFGRDIFLNSPVVSA